MIQPCLTDKQIQLLLQRAGPNRDCGHFVLAFLFFIGRSRGEQADWSWGSNKLLQRSRL
jgi:hypothetical protein